MKLVIHAGLHKTGTKSFQNFCAENSNHLANNGIFYPIIDSSIHHHQIAKLLIYNKIEKLKELLRGIIHQSKISNCENILLSSEDFEYLLIDNDLAGKLEEILLKLGINEIEWIFVIRNHWEYFNSLYSEKSKHGVIINYNLMAKEILDTGHVSIMNKKMRWKFVFQYASKLKQFRKATRGRIFICSFEEFNSTKPGFFILKDLFDTHENLELFYQDCKYANNVYNTRLNDEIIEFNYICNFLGFRRSKKFLKLKTILLYPFIKRRIKLRKNIEHILKDQFHIAFSKDIEKAINFSHSAESTGSMALEK